MLRFFVFMVPKIHAVWKITSIGICLNFREKEDMYKALVEGHFFLADTYLDVTRRGQPHNLSSASRYTNAVLPLISSDGPFKNRKILNE
jgi:hypothetical protein